MVVYFPLEKVTNLINQWYLKLRNITKDKTKRIGIQIRAATFSSEY